MLLSLSSQVSEARVLSGSRTEKKMNRKIERLLKSARKDYDKGKVQDALDTYWKILEIDPQETFAYLELGEIYYNLRIYNRAVELLEPGTQTAAMEMDPDTVSYYYSVLTQAYIELNQLGPASKALIKAAEAAPRNPLPRKILGDIYLANNRIKSAYKAYKKALSFDPGYEPALEKVAEIKRDYEKELKAVRTVKKPSPGPKSSTSGSSSPSKKTVEPTVSEDNDISDLDERPMPMPAISGKAVAKNTEPAKPVETRQPPADKNVESAVMPLPVQSSPKKIPENDKVAPVSAVPDIQADPDQIDLQIDKLLAGTPSEKNAAVAFFVALKKDGLIEIEDLLFDSDPEVRIIAIRTLTAFTGFKERVMNILADAADDPDPEVRKEIKRALTSLQ
jgi:tetratricopeptide (TPR) repeat protein